MLLNLLLAVCGIIAVAFISFRKFPRQPTGIHDLPLELLSEIASHLDFVDMISLRQSARKLREATEARVVWYSLAKRYAARHFNVPRPENGTIDALSTNDLREWIWPRLTIDQIWRRKAVVPKTRILDTPKDTMYLGLVPGGRWLLTIRETGQVDFYDLNSENPVPQLLLEPSVPGEEAGPTQIITQVIVDINHEKPVLDFTFAFSSCRSILHLAPWFGWLHIRRARLVGTGPTATLTAHELISIPHIRRDVPTCAIGLHCDLAARAVLRGQVGWIEVFKWKECTSTELVIASIRVGENLRSGRIYFIGEDRVLCVAHNVWIYTMPPPSRLVIDWDPEVGYQSDKDVTHPVWTYSKKSLASNSIPSFAFDGTDGYRLVVQDKITVVGIYIPLSPDHQPCVRFRVQHEPMPSAGIGLHKGCTAHVGALIVRFGYRWDGDVDANFIKTRGDDSSKFWDFFFDEETGRCLKRQSAKEIKVIDFI